MNKQLSAQDIARILRGKVPTLGQTFNGDAWQLSLEVNDPRHHPEKKIRCSYILQVQTNWSSEPDRYTFLWGVDDGTGDGYKKCLTDEDFDERVDLIVKMEGEDAADEWAYGIELIEHLPGHTIFQVLVERWRALQHIVTFAPATDIRG